MVINTLVTGFEFEKYNTNEIRTRKIFHNKMPIHRDFEFLRTGLFFQNIIRS